jgi:hypothetical protein
MDGEPAVNLIVAMKPDVGRTAMAKTNSKGYYEIEYTDGEKGTKVGPTSVHVEWPTGFAGAFGIPKSHAPGNKENTLNVIQGKQTYNIEMVSEAGKSKQKPAMVD